MFVTDMFIDNRLTCMRYHSDGRRQDGRTFGRTNEWKKNIQTNRVTNNSTQKHAYRRADGHTDGRTHIQIIFVLVYRRTETYTKLYNYIRTDGRRDHRIEGQLDKHFHPHAHRHSHAHTKIKFSWSKRNSANQCLMKSIAQLNYVVRSTY